MDIFKAINEIMAEVGAVPKNGVNQHQHFSFRGIDAVINALSPLLIKHGVITVPTVIDRQVQIIEIGRNESKMVFVSVRIKYDLYAISDGSSVSCTVDAESMDTGDKATSKACSVAWRTMLTQVFALATGEPDPDASSPNISNARLEDTHDYWAGATTTQKPVVMADKAPTCTHGAMKYWQSSKTGQAYYFCSLDKDDPEACKSVKA